MKKMDDDVRRANQNDNDRDKGRARLQKGGSWQGLPSDTLELEIDAALAGYAAVKPRVGLPDRILANLRQEQERVGEHSWRPWSTIAAVAAMLVIAVSITTHRRAMTPRPDQQPERPVAANGTAAPSHPTLPQTEKPTRGGIRRPQGSARSAPRLAQFPSPRPPSEQEQLLVRFVQEFPEEAAVIARAQAESEKEMEQSSGDRSSGTNSDQPDQQER